MKRRRQGCSSHEFDPQCLLLTGLCASASAAPVGSGKTTLTEKLCKAMRGRYSIAVVTNDIYTPRKTP